MQPLVTVILCWWPRCVQVGRRFTKNHYMMHGQQNVKFCSSSLSSAGACTKIIVKLLNFPLILNEHILSSTASKFIIACLYFLLIRKPVPEVLLSLPLYQYEIHCIQHSTSHPCYLLDCCNINSIFFQFCFNLI